MVRLDVLNGHPPWVVYRIKVSVSLSVGIWLDANKFWPSLKSGAAWGWGWLHKIRSILWTREEILRMFYFCSIWESQQIGSASPFLLLSNTVCACVCVCKTEHSRAALTFSQEVFKEPSGVVLWILQMDIGSPPGSRSVVRGLFITYTQKNTRAHATLSSWWSQLESQRSSLQKTVTLCSSTDDNTGQGTRYSQSLEPGQLQSVFMLLLWNHDGHYPGENILYKKWRGLRFVLYNMTT